ncbi:hypothetical protein [Pseudonocardia sp. HH130629-09]|uniref:hypothetical protein n=1 Tax=Pseudonocardia sp. HH130629-09 TaxID=1641402 RepID=UPI0006CB783B|nr:hypothetical protein [Pseudonocardia sp. HH130629-09]ALE82488.1 hypothetical protein XF36_04465 [Pseudonocardia sp. HH130629-09]
MTRALRLLACVATLLLVGAGTAFAHSDGLSAEAFLPRVVAVEPPVPGLSVAAVEGGARLGVVNATGIPVRVLPPDGLALAEEPTVPPGERGHWADRRVAAASAERPADGRAAAWSVPLLVGSDRVEVRGETTWPAPPSTAGWWSLTLALAVGAAALGSAAVRRAALAPAVGAVAVLAVAAHVVHALGSALVPVDEPYWPTVLGTAGIGLGAWAAVLVGAVLTLWRTPWGLLLCSVGGTILALVTAFDTSSFARAVLPYGWPPTVDRVSTALAVGIGAGLFLTGFAVLRAMTPDDDLSLRPIEDPR